MDRALIFIAISAILAILVGSLWHLRRKHKAKKHQAEQLADEARRARVRPGAANLTAAMPGGHPGIWVSRPAPQPASSTAPAYSPSPSAIAADASYLSLHDNLSSGHGGHSSPPPPSDDYGSSSFDSSSGSSDTGSSSSYDSSSTSSSSCD